ncbi:polyketide cyclase [Sphingomonas sp. DBB INV C78]|uniref:nuclear transport factor 2 family protein n=1 Tax=Sphingomonas sp. DBB INV C78 TaxID=3349434 RepID=UPI0036D2D31B
MKFERTKARPVCADDERAIIAVLLRYATGIDSRDWPLFRTCFSDDFEADYGSFGKWRGPREITDYMRQAHAHLGPTLHRLTNFTVEDDSTHVRARSYVDALLMPLATGGPIHRGIGWYDDQMVRTSEGWKIARRQFTPVRLA